LFDTCEPFDMTRTWRSN